MNKVIQDFIESNLQLLEDNDLPNLILAANTKLTDLGISELFDVLDAAGVTNKEYLTILQDRYVKTHQIIRAAEEFLPYITKFEGTDDSFKILFEDDQSYYEYTIEGIKQNNNSYTITFSETNTNPRSFSFRDSDIHILDLTMRQIKTLLSRFRNEYYKSSSSGSININNILKGFRSK